METIEQLKTQIKELGKQAAELSRQAVEAGKINREQGRSLMIHAREASKRCQVLIQELKRQQA